jgi:hypothetical protein
MARRKRTPTAEELTRQARKQAQQDSAVYTPQGPGERYSARALLKRFKSAAAPYLGQEPEEMAAKKKRKRKRK